MPRPCREIRRDAGDRAVHALARQDPASAPERLALPRRTDARSSTGKIADYPLTHDRPSCRAAATANAWREDESLCWSRD